MNFPVLVVIRKEDAQTMADVKKAVAKLMESLDDDYFTSQEIERFDAWAIGGRYAVDSPDAEQIPMPAGLESLPQGVEVDGKRVVQPEKQSFFGNKVMVPVAELTDEQCEKFDMSVLYHEPTERELAEAWFGPTRAECRTKEECRRALFPDAFAVVVDAVWITPEERSWPTMKSAYGPNGPDAVTLWKIRNKKKTSAA